MIKIAIYSGDTLYARMLMHELHSVYVPQSIEIFINNREAELDRKRDIVIVDLDGHFTSHDFSLFNVIGFSSDIEALSTKKNSFCREILHRPFIIDELKDAVLRIIESHSEEKNEISTSSNGTEALTFNDNSTVTFAGDKIHLSSNEYKILLLLAQNQSKAVSRCEINKLLGGDYGNMCDVYICKIRSKLAEHSDKKMIFTVRNQGYMFKLK